MRKGTKSTGQEIAVSCLVFCALGLHHLGHEAAHGLCRFVLLLPRDVGVGAQGESGVVVAQLRKNGHCIFERTVLSYHEETLIGN